MCIICLTHINQPLFIGTSARRLCRQKITKLRPSEWCTYIRSCLLVARKASDTPPHRCTSSWGPGLLATLPDWVSRVKTRSGTERRNQITPIDHLLPLHFSESPGHTHPQNQSPAITSAAVALLRPASPQRQRRLCSAGLASQIARHRATPLPPLTVTGHVIVMEELQDSLPGRLCG